MEDKKITIKNTSHVVIHGWMLTELGLKGNELLVYAVIYGFTQSVDDQLYTGSRQHLADWCGATKKTVDNAIISLCNKGYIIRHEKFVNNVMFVDYSCADPEEFFKNPVSTGEKNFRGGGEKITPGVAKNFRGGGEKFSPHNIEHNIDNNIEHNKEKEKKENLVETDLSEIKSRKTNFDKIIDGYTENEKLRAALNDFIKMRKAIKKVLTDRALSMICRELDKLAADDDTKIAVLEQSIMNSWQGVFPLKEGNSYSYGNGNAANNQQFMVQPNNGAGSGQNGRADYRVTEGLI